MPLWDESFTFDIYRGDDPLFIKVCTMNALYQVKALATAYLNIMQFRSQEKRTLWYELSNKSKIKLTVEFVHSRVRKLDTQIMRLDQKQKNYEYIRKVAVTELERMKNVLAGIVDSDNEDDVPYILGPVHRVNFEERRVANRVDDWIAKRRFGKHVDETQAYIYTDPTRDFPWFTVFMYSSFVFLVLCLLVCFFKPDFLCLTIAATSIYLCFFYREAK